MKGEIAEIFGIGVVKSSDGDNPNGAKEFKRKKSFECSLEKGPNSYLDNDMFFSVLNAVS